MSYLLFSVSAYMLLCNLNTELNIYLISFSGGKSGHYAKLIFLLILDLYYGSRMLSDRKIRAVAIARIVLLTFPR